jgi:serine/threonine protein kinase
VESQEHAFVILEQLGQGGMGSVYRALDSQANREVALKVVSSRVSSPVQLERFRREGELAASLNHPGILKIHFSGNLEGRPFLAYELIPSARTLEDVLHDLSLREAVVMVRDVALALGHAHQQGIVHRDVKPANILIDEQGRPLVGDFGLSTAQGDERLTRTGGLAGTPSFMAPEQFLGKDYEPTPAIDVWALCVVLYWLLSKALPFDASTIHELAAQISSNAPRALRDHDPTLPPDLEAICRRGMSTDPQARYADGDALARDLDRYLGGDTVLASAEGSATRMARWAGAGVGTLALVGAVGFFFLHVGDPMSSHSTPSPGVQASSSPATSLEWPLWYHALAPADRPPLPLPDTIRFGKKGTYENVRDNSILVWIPPSPGFVTGGEESKGEPQPVAGFFMGKYEVSWAQYTEFCQASGYPTPRAPFYNLCAPNPVVNVSFKDARAYCHWNKLRLPTEVEWERATRGTSERWLPWGNRSGTLREVNSLGIKDGYSTVAPVDSFPQGVSPFGCLHTIGNVAEWTHSDVDRGGQRVVRGDGFDGRRGRTDAAWVKRIEKADYSDEAIGFRVAR